MKLINSPKTMKKLLLIFFSLLLCLGSSNSLACYESYIVSPSPFMGNDDEIFKLSDGSLWQVKFEYEYLYEYHPDVIICPSHNVLILNSKKLNVINLSGFASPSDSQLFESRIEGEFNGWDGNTIVKLANGQIWEQVDYHYEYRYAYRPKVLVYKTGNIHRMQVERTRKPVRVRPIR